MNPVRKALLVTNELCCEAACSKDSVGLSDHMDIYVYSISQARSVASPFETAATMLNPSLVKNFVKMRKMLKLIFSHHAGHSGWLL